MSGFAEYAFIELSLACSSCDAQEKFWTEVFGGEVIFRGKMMGQPFTRLMVCGISLIFREDPAFVPPPGPESERLYRDHLGLRVRDLDAAIADLESKGVRFVLTPAIVRQFQQKKQDDGRKYLETDYVKPPLTPERMAAGEFRHDVAIALGPDNLWIELNEIKEPADTRWYPGS